MLRRGTAVIATVAGVLALGAAPASASDTVNWKAVKTSSNWHCTEYVGTDTPGVNVKMCIVVNSGHYAQGVLVAQNASNQHVGIKGRIRFESEYGGDVWCAWSQLSKGATAGCYAPTVGPFYQTTNIATGDLTVDGYTTRVVKGQVPTGI
ncbi:hypothetical protein ACF1G0_07460 [Streptomyces sp. NPDC013953]|uniref:hypothetical protein n=1 Tax=Streptomyces sp. NPDC013953 TaxID=3364868 RepID=UPI0036FF41EA